MRAATSSEKKFCFFSKETGSGQALAKRVVIALRVLTLWLSVEK
jgi:hypothetical protein